LLGCCGIGKLDGEHPEIGYWLGVPFWGKGYATEAARALIDHAFGELGYDVLVSGARVSNPASRRVLQKCGFEWTGVGLYRIRALASSGAGRSLPSRPRSLGLTQELGQSAQRSLIMLQTCIATRDARLALRPVHEGDDEALFPLFADWEVIRWLSSPPWPYTREDMQRFIREQTAADGEDAETRFAITLEQTPIGILSVRTRTRQCSAARRWSEFRLLDRAALLGPRIYDSGASQRRGPRLPYGTPRGGLLRRARGKRCVVAGAGEGRVRADGKAMLYARPRGGEFPHVNTMLTRTGFVSD
jgi:RimJ/RimL family protein N-acetyltransferase